MYDVRGEWVIREKTNYVFQTTKGVECEIRLKDYRPIVLPPRHMPLKFHEACEKEVKTMLADNIIEPSTSPYCTYPVLADKKDGGSVRDLWLQTTQ